MQKWTTDLSSIFCWQQPAFLSSKYWWTPIHSRDSSSLWAYFKPTNNRDETTLFFDKYVSQDMKNAIIYLLRVLEVKGCEKYLGLPVVLVEIKGLALITSRKGCVRNLKVKRKNYCRKHEERGSDKSSRSSYSRFCYMLFLLASWSLSWH